MAHPLEKLRQYLKKRFNLEVSIELLERVNRRLALAKVEPIPTSELFVAFTNYLFEELDKERLESN